MLAFVVLSLVPERDATEHNDPSKISVEGLGEGFPGKGSALELRMQGSFVREASGIHRDSSDSEVSSDMSSGAHDHKLLTLEGEESANHSATNNNTPFSIDVFNHECCGKNESESDSSPCCQDGNSSFSTLDKEKSYSYSSDNANSKSNPHNPILWIFVVVLDHTG